LNKNFKNQDSSEPITTIIQAFLRGVRLITSPILPPNEVFCLGFGAWAHLSTSGITLNVLTPFLKLKANCLNIKSMVFFANCGNRALSPLSCRWLMPKYCSTMYRNLEIPLLRWISRSVSFALTWSLRIIPSLRL